MNKIKQLIFKISLIHQKERAIYEASKDMEYLMNFKGDMIKYDESKARKRMAELKAKENRTEVEEAELEQVISTIAESKSVKLNYRKTVELKEDLEKYISII